MATLEYNGKRTMPNEISCIVFIFANMDSAAVRMWIHTDRFFLHRYILSYLYNVCLCVFVFAKFTSARNTTTRYGPYRAGQWRPIACAHSTRAFSIDCSFRCVIATITGALHFELACLWKRNSRIRCKLHAHWQCVIDLKDDALNQFHQHCLNVYFVKCRTYATHTHIKNPINVLRSCHLVVNQHSIRCTIMTLFLCICFYACCCCR